MNQSRRSITIFMVFVLSVSLVISGCWDGHELNDQYIILGFSIDKAGDKIRLSIRTVKGAAAPSMGKKEDSGSEELAFNIFSAEGDSISDAAKGLDHLATRYIYGGHTQVLFIGEELAREGIMPYLDYFIRNRLSRDTSWIVIAKNGKGEDLLTLTDEHIKYPSKTIDDLVRKKTIHVPNLFEFLLNYHGDSMTQALAFDQRGKEKTGPPGFQINQLYIQQGALFREDKLVGYLSDTDSETYNWLQDGFHNVNFDPGIAGDTGDVGLLLKGNPASIKIMKRDGLSVNIEVNLDFYIMENAPSLQGPKEIGELEESVDRVLEQRVRSLFTTLQQEKMDVFNIAEKVHAYQNKRWQELKNNWPENYAQLPIQIHVYSHYRNPITMSKSPAQKD